MYQFLSMFGGNRLLKLSDFTDDDRVHYSFEAADAISDYDIVLNLEAYKFMNREQIVQRLNDLLCDQLEYSFVDSVTYERYHFSEEEKFPEFLAFQVQANELLIVINAFSNVTLNALILALSKYSLTFVRVTPLHFLSLKNEDYTFPYDPLLLFRRILIEAIDRRATDIHFDVLHDTKDPTYTIRCRIDNLLLPLDLFTITKQLNSDMILKLVANCTNMTTIDLGSGIYGVTALASNIFGNENVQLRVSAKKVLDGYHCVIRIQGKQTFSLKLPELGFCETVQNDLEMILKKHSGITLITGAMRTGKNTTAFALLHELAKQPVKIVSYESPIEVLMPFTQLDYNDNIDSLLESIKLAKKQDVNIAYLNEIPNKEVAFAIQDLANSAIHVITTMHMDRVWHLPYKIKEYFGQGYKDIISQINGVFNQKMFAVSCPNCLEQVLVSDLHDKRKADLLSKYGYTSILVSHGCEHCNGSGQLRGVNQPYMDHIIFSDEFKQKLLRCEFPYQMEQLIFAYVMEHKQSLEYYMTEAVASGKLNYNALDYIL